MDTAAHDVIRIQHGARVFDRDVLVVEAPIEFRIHGVPVAVLMRTPGNDAELALGFCLTEGILLHPGEFADLAADGDGDRFSVVLAPEVEIDPEQFRRNTYTTSSCGVCGKASIDAVRIAARPATDGPFMPAGSVSSLPERLRSLQPAFDATGGIHAAVIFSGAGEPLSVAEDVGRHNAVDKAVGALARSAWPLPPSVLCVSGRVSFEIVQKAAVAGIPMVVGVSAASSLAVELAEELGMTLVGFARGASMVVYTDPGRITD